MTGEALTDSDQMFRALVEYSTHAIMLFSPDGTILYANPSTLQLLSPSPDKLVGNAFQLIHPQDLADVQSALTGLLDHPGDFVPVIFRLQQQSTSWRWMEGTIRNCLQVPQLGALICSCQDVTERKQAEEEARIEAEKAHIHLYQLFMQAPANIAIMHGPDHRFELANPLFLQTVGRVDMLGKSARSLLPEIAAQGYGDIMDEVYSTGRPFFGKEQSVQIDRHGDGTLEEGFFNFVYQPFRNVQGQIEGIMLHGVEVTEQVLARRRVEELVNELRIEREALRLTEQASARQAAQLSAIIESITDGLIVCDKEGLILHINAATRHFIGPAIPPDTSLFSLEATMPDWLTPRDMQSRPLPQKDWPLTRVLHGESLSGNETVDVLFYNPQGEPIFLNVSGAPILDEKGAKNGAVIALRNVTLRHTLEQKLQYSERKLRSLVEANILGVAVVETEGRILEVNDLIIDTLGYSRDELLDPSFHWRSLTPPEQRIAEAQAVKQLLSTGTTPPRERSYLRKDGSRFPALITATMIDQERNLALIVILNISDRKAAERRKQEFLSMVSHELRTPLTGIVGFLDLALFSIRQLSETRSFSSEQLELVQRVEWMLQQADQHATMETRLVEALLDVARMERHLFKLSLKACNLVEVVRNVTFAQLQIAGARPILLELPQQEQVSVIIDADRIQQVIINYLTNALKYAPADQEITVGLDIGDEGIARVYVRDKGPGLTDVQQEQVWERFYQIDPSANQEAARGGLGLGLYIARVLVEQHHGRVGVTSRLGEGSTFWFTLPIVE